MLASYAQQYWKETGSYPWKSVAVAWKACLLCLYLESSRLILSTDHEASKWVVTSIHTLSKLERLQLRLIELDFEVLYRAENKHKAASTLSVSKTERTDRRNLYGELTIVIIDETEKKQYVVMEYFDKDKQKKN